MSGVKLSIRDLSVVYGGVVALDGVSIDVGEGRLVGLIGPNGAGKTTLIDAVSGYLRGTATGQVELDGRDITDKAPHARAHLGLTRTWQSVELFDDITVRENLEVAVHRLTLRGAFTNFFTRGDTDPFVDETLEKLKLTEVADTLPRDLSMGMRKLAGVARAVVQRPGVVLLDEPAAGLDMSETAWLGERLRELNESGTAMLLVDHDMSLVMSVCAEINVLEFGRLIASGGPSEVRGDPRVIRAYLGGEEESA